MWSVNSDQRISLNLSDQAWDVLERDMESFRCKNYAGFISQVFENYHRRAQASIAATVQRQRNAVQTALNNAGVRPDAECQRLARALTVAEKDRLVAQHTGYPTGTSRLLRLRDDAYESLTDELAAREEPYYKRPSAYLKAVIEEYCRLRPTDREQVFFDETFKRIRQAIEKGCELKLTSRNGTKYILKPYCLAEDAQAAAWYVAGYSRKPGEGVRSGKIASFKVSSLNGAKLQEDAEPLSNREKKALAAAIRSRGIQFLLYDEATVVVELTDAGVKKYKRMSSLRPPEISSEGNTFTFCCTEAQAEYYFMRLAGDAKVIKPESLQQRMAEIYENACAVYRKKD